MKKQNLFLTSLLVASMFTLMSHSIEAHNQEPPRIAIGVIIGACTYVGLTEAFYRYTQKQLENEPAFVQTLINTFNLKSIEQKRHDDYLKNVAIPCASIIAGLLGYSLL